MRSALLLTATLVCTTALSASVRFTDSAVRLSGARMHVVNGTALFDFPGGTATTSFTGVTSIDASLLQMIGPNPDLVQAQRFKAILTDSSTGKLSSSVISTASQPSTVAPTSYHLFDHLNATRNYTLRFIKISEAQWNQIDIQPNYVEFHGFTADGPAPTWVALPAPNGRRIEFLGDSITCGYCNLCRQDPDGDGVDIESFFESWAHRTCDAFAADCHTEAWSGYGMAFNCCGGDVTVPILFNRTLATVAAADWDFSQWVPQAVVINLGTNDHLNATDPTGQRQITYVDTYVKVVKQIVTAYGSGVEIFLACGPMATAYCPYVEQVMALTKGIASTHFLDQRDVLTQENSCCGHPDTAADAFMARLTVNVVEAVMGWIAQ